MPRFDDFDEMYSIVTDRLQKSLDPSHVQATEEAWFEYLILTFRQYFDVWPTEPALRKYFELFEHRRCSPLLRLAGHAFLHVGLDLPRAIAPSLSRDASGLGGTATEDRFGKPMEFPTERNDARSVYLQAMDAFGTAMDSPAMTALFRRCTGPLYRVLDRLAGKTALARSAQQFVSIGCSLFAALPGCGPSCWRMRLRRSASGWQNAC